MVLSTALLIEVAEGSQMPIAATHDIIHLTMVRYSAIQFDGDHDDDENCHATPMDWTIITDVDNFQGNHNHADTGDDNSDNCLPVEHRHDRSDVSHIPSSKKKPNGCIKEHNTDYNGDRGNNSWSLVLCTKHAEVIDNRGRRGNGLHTDDPHRTHRDNFDRENVGSNHEPLDSRTDCPPDFFQMTQHYLHEQQIFEQQQWRKSRQKKITVLTISVVIVGIVLNRHAPPPPPVIQTPLISTFLSTDPESHHGFSISSGMMKSPGTTLVTQHETWASYSRHILFLAYHAFLYGVSVAWYAVSNAFRYAAEEVGIELLDFARSTSMFAISLFRGDDHNTVENYVWADWKKKLTYISVSLSATSYHLNLNQNIPSQTRPQKHHQDTQFKYDIQKDDNAIKKPWCPIRIPAVSNRRTHLPRGVTQSTMTTRSNIFEGWPTEEFLRQTVQSLEPQFLALKLMAEGIDSWGEQLVEVAPVELVHRMATFRYRSFMENGSNDDGTFSQWILPPATGVLLVGPEGVGKLLLAHRLAHLLFSHCTEDAAHSVHNKQMWSEGMDSSCAASTDGVECMGNIESYEHASLTENELSGFDSSRIHELEGVLEIVAEDYVHHQIHGSNDYDNNLRNVHPVKELIINHILQRHGFGSVVILHHIELLPKSLLSDIANVLSRKSDTLSYETPKKEAHASCEGTVFVFTSTQWGTKSIFQNIQSNGGLSGLRRESLISSIRWEVDSNFGYWTKFASVSLLHLLFCILFRIFLLVL